MITIPRKELKRSNFKTWVKKKLNDTKWVNRSKGGNGK